MRAVRMLMIGLVVALAGCSNEDGVRKLSSIGDGPDEFRIVPGKPLTQPKTYTDLPTPTPGEGNITDLDPVGDAVTALGGSRKALNASTISSADGALVNYTSRLGRSSEIRQTVAVEDAEFRKQRGRFTNIRLVRKDRYNEVYEQQMLDPGAEWWRWRKAGAKTPAVPPSR